MTDHPRFQSATGGPDRFYRQYQSAALVAWVLSAPDWWLSRRPRGALRRVHQHLSQYQIDPTSSWRTRHDAP